MRTEGVERVGRAQKETGTEIWQTVMMGKQCRDSRLLRELGLFSVFLVPTEDASRRQKMKTCTSSSPSRTTGGAKAQVSVEAG